MMADHHITNSRPNNNIQDSYRPQAKQPKKPQGKHMFVGTQIKRLVNPHNQK
jgi:hypothetical protein